MLDPSLQKLIEKLSSTAAEVEHQLNAVPSQDLIEQGEPSDISGSNPKAMSSDTAARIHDTGRMNDITREEFNAKLETIEVKMDARVEAMTAKIDGFLAAQIERDKRLDLILAQISQDSSEAKSSISSMKTTLIVTAVSTVLAIVIGVASFNTSLTSNMMSAFQLGASQAERTSKDASSPASKPDSTQKADPDPSNRQ